MGTLKCCIKLFLGYVLYVYMIHIQILCLDMEPIPKLSHDIYENILKSKKKIQILIQGILDKG